MNAHAPQIVAASDDTIAASIAEQAQMLALPAPRINLCDRMYDNRSTEADSFEKYADFVAQVIPEWKNWREGKRAEELIATYGEPKQYPCTVIAQYSYFEHGSQEKPSMAWEFGTVVMRPQFRSFQPERVISG